MSDVSTNAYKNVSLLVSLGKVDKKCVMMLLTMADERKLLDY